jgi:hypothetical protein
MDCTIENQLERAVVAIMAEKADDYGHSAINEEDDLIRFECGAHIAGEDELFLITRENLASFMHDLMQGGCESGFIGELVYYSDTHKFAKLHADDIRELLLERAEDGSLEGVGPDKLLDLNWQAWFAFEETAQRLAEQAGWEG